MLRTFARSLLFGSLFTFEFGSLGAFEPFFHEYQVVKGLHILQEGRPLCNEAAVVASLKTKEGGTFSHSLFDRDIKQLSLTYERVEPRIVEGEEGVDITLVVSQKPIVHAIIWKGNTRISSKALKKELGVEVGSWFDSTAVNEGIRKLQSYYIKRGFFEVEVDYKVEESDCNSVAVIISIDEGRSGKIGAIRFCHFSPCEEEELVEMMVTKKYNLFISWFNQAGILSHDALERDRAVILKYLHDRGYADAVVDIEIKEMEDRERIALVITAKRGRQYTVGNITIGGATLLEEQNVREQFSLSCGSPFSPELLREAIFALTHYYGRFGYIETDIKPEIILRPDSTIYDIHLAFDVGQRYRVGLVKISGNCITEERVILHETLLKPGEVFNSDKLRVTEERLRNIGYFKNVSVYPIPSNQANGLPEGYRDVQIEVEETTTGHLGFSLGYSTLENLFCEAKVTERNFDYRGLFSLLQGNLCGLRGGGEYAHLTVTFGAKSSRYLVSWTKPFFMDTPWSVGFDVERSYSRYISDDYDIRATGFNLHAGYQMNAFMRFGWHYRLRNTQVVTDGDVPHELRKEAHVRGLVSATGISLIYDSTNRPVDPSCGFKSRLEFEFAGLGGDHSFLSYGYLNSYYFPIGENGVLLVRADFKFLDPFGRSRPHTLPLDERFFLGGEYTVRGFRPYRLGPKFDGDDPRGGISLQYYSIEYSRPLMRRVEGFAFVDAGQLSLKRWHFGGINVSAGYGVRLNILPNTPPLMIGMGYPFHAKNRSDVKRFFLTIGGRF